MKTKNEIQDKLAQLRQWKEMADRQHDELLNEIDRLTAMGSRHSQDIEQLRVWRTEHIQQSQKVQSLQLITIPGFCCNQNIVGISSTLGGMISALSWILEG